MTNVGTVFIFSDENLEYSFCPFFLLCSLLHVSICVCGLCVCVQLFLKVSETNIYFLNGNENVMIFMFALCMVVS